jgi:glycosyltransferase involved in cell wall biosynthesis
MTKPEIAILVSSFERPRHVRRVLASIAAQRGVAGALEVVVTDDGSRDDTARLVRQFAASASFPVRFVTHPHDGFHISRCRNEGVAASTAPYLLFLDGDCVIPPDHIRTHLDRRENGYCLAGYPIHLNEAIAEQITEQHIRDGSYLQQVATFKKLKMKWRHLRAVMYSLLRDPKRPKLLGGNLGIARADYERVNGYDENFRGWGCEDDDLRMRLRAAGVGVKSIAWWTHTYHLWHPKTPTAPRAWRDGANVDYLQRPLRLTRCLAGIVKRRLQDLNVRLVGQAPAADDVNRALPLWCRVAMQTSGGNREAPEIELAFCSTGSFSRTADCRVLIVPAHQRPFPPLAGRADLIFCQDAVPPSAQRCHPLRDFDRVLQQQLGLQPVATQPRLRQLPAERLALPVAA